MRIKPERGALFKNKSLWKCIELDRQRRNIDHLNIEHELEILDGLPLWCSFFFWANYVAIAQS